MLEAQHIDDDILEGPDIRAMTHQKVDNLEDQNFLRWQPLKTCDMHNVSIVLKTTGERW